ncbi:Glycoside hydrolase family 92 [Neofusicoccum parvum]|nr:Glycoside hydrolase family 92 [Neofusicoccum parvum]
MAMGKSLGRLRAAAAVVACVAGVVEARLTDFVDPLIGTVGPTPGSTIAGGNSFPGAALPWGMVKAGIDTSYLGLADGLGNDCNAGYSPIGNVTAVSLTHVSGSGGVPTYGLISQMPLLGTLEGVNLGDNMTYWQNRSLDQESASVGLFTTTLLNGIKIEITSGNHSALIRYTFPPSSNSNTSSSTPSLSPDAPSASNNAHIFVDLTHVLPAFDADAQPYSQKFLHGDLHTRSTSTSQPSYFGSASYVGGWSQPDIHTLHFCGNFSSSPSLAPVDALAAPAPGPRVPGAATLSWPYNPALPPADPPVPRSYADVRSSAGAGLGLGALFSWAGGSAGVANASAAAVVEARVGVSYVSAARACAHVADELPAGTGFEAVVERARAEWEERVLGAVTVEEDESAESGNATLKRMLYSALYQTGLMPTDKTGENPWWESDEERPYFDDHYTLWDTYRTTLPLYHLIYTSTYARIVKGLINIFKYEGYLPAGRTANWNGRVQGGTHADTVLADAFVKSVVSAPTNNTTGRGELALSPADWADALAALVTDADAPPARNVDPVAFDGATKEGRGALDEQLRLRFLTRNHTRSLSRGVEYPQNDFAVWSVAAGLLGANANASSLVSPADVARYRDRADWWREQWNPQANTTLDGVGTFTGFVGARDADGAWNFTDYDPRSCGKCGWGSDIYEAKVWETSFSAAPHDMAKIVELMGGDDGFLKRLDASFLPGFGTSVGANNDAGSALFNPGNEPSFATPFLYNYVPGNNWKTVNQSRAIVDTFYSDARNGYPGNIDSGALPSWLIFNLIGLYPIAGQPLYLLGAPRFSSLTIRLFPGTPQETSLKIKASNMSDTSFYPQRVTLNGAALDRAWLSHSELVDGGELVFEMGAEPAKWDIGERPWSLSPW